MSARPCVSARPGRLHLSVLVPCTPNPVCVCPSALATSWLLKRKGGWGTPRVGPQLVGPPPDMPQPPGLPLPQGHPPTPKGWGHVPSTPLQGLGRRRALLEAEGRLVQGALGLALGGVALMVLDMELAWAGACQWPPVPILLRGLVSASTLVLLGLILAFHIKDIQLYMLEYGLKDWRVAVGPARLGLILLELGVCALHPPPPPLGPPCPLAGPGLGLALAMLLRLYLVPRAALMGAAPGAGGALGGLGGLGRVRVRGPFALRALLARHPAALLLALALGAWVLSAWVLAACERGVPGGAGGLGATLWLVPITFLTIGYGDLVPSTICGRLVCLVTGILGVGCTALLVAVAAEKLEFTRAEKHVHNFMLGMECARKMKHTAATILQEAWRVHRYRRRQEPARARQHQRRLLSALHTFREVRLQHRALREQVNSMVDISKMQLVLDEISAGLSSGQQELRQRLDGLEWKLDALARRLGAPSPPPTPPGR